ncbi:MAG: hypothetical protein ABEJ74_01145 [Haloferacaceae archaeon]
MPTFSDLARAAYCPRQLYYARREDDHEPPATVRDRIDLAYRYRDLRGADDDVLAGLPIDRPPGAYRAALENLAEREDWPHLADPPHERTFLQGKDCRGIAYKILPGGEGANDEEQSGARAGEPPVPTVVSPGEPPERGVWKPQRVRAVAVANALAWERERPVERALVEYPASGVVRTVRLTTRNCAAYREALRTVRSLDGPPRRLHDRSKCGACEYRTACGVKTRSLRSLLGL